MWGFRWLSSIRGRGHRFEAGLGFGVGAIWIGGAFDFEEGHLPSPLVLSPAVRYLYLLESGFGFGAGVRAFIPLHSAEAKPSATPIIFGPVFEWGPKR